MLSPRQMTTHSQMWSSGLHPSQAMTSGTLGRSMLRREDSRLIDVSQLNEGHRVISERLVENEIKVPRKVYREEIREKVMIVPEKVHREEVVEEIVRVREKIIEIAKPVYQERIVEVPEIEYIEKITEVPEIVYEEKIVEVPRVEIIEKVSRVPRVIVQEKVIEVPEYEYRDVEVEKIVEVPEIVEEIVYKEVLVDHFVEVEVPETQEYEVAEDIDRYLPVPVEAITFYEFRLPKVTAKYRKAPYPIYAPRFIEVPIPTSAIDELQMDEVNFVLDNVQRLCANPCPNLCEVEKLAEYAKTRSYNFQIDQSLLQQKFAVGQL